MERRGFLKGTLAGAGAIMAGARSAGLGSPSAAQLNRASVQGRSPAVLVEIPGTRFQTKDALTGVDVTVALDRFLMSPTETTQREFEDVMGYNPSFHRGSDLPVESVSWWEAIRYCNLRSVKENFEPCYNLASGACDLRRNGYRLPTEAEWSHAASDEPTPAPATRPTWDLRTQKTSTSWFRTSRRRARSRSAFIRRTDTVSTTCSGMFGNGVLTSLIRCSVRKPP